MKNSSLKLFIIIDYSKILLAAGSADEQNNLRLLENITLPIVLNNNKILDLKNVTDQIRKNILIIEQKINFTFKESIIILNYFDISFLNFTGYRKLNGSQISKENITYIINSLKSCVDEHENDKKILHIFNTNFFLDKKKIDNIPIGLFGDFYTHELSFNMINNNDFKNLKSIFDSCNIKIEKIITDSFVKSTTISDNYPEIDNFFHIQLNDDNCKIFYVENESLKFEQMFKFGTKIVAKDISKITSLKFNAVKKIIENNSCIDQASSNELIEKKYFIEQQYRKIKKNLISEIADARINEFVEILFLKNINFKEFLSKTNVIFIEMDDQEHLDCFKNIYTKLFSSKKKFQVNIIKKIGSENLIEAAYKITQFGWKKEAIPITRETGSYIARIFRTIFS